MMMFFDNDDTVKNRKIHVKGNTDRHSPDEGRAYSTGI